jgi:hypothetical protein
MGSGILFTDLPEKIKYLTPSLHLSAGRTAKIGEQL